jgi:hypothetical protein
MLFFQKKWFCCVSPSPTQPWARRRKGSNGVSCKCDGMEERSVSAAASFINILLSYTNTHLATSEMRWNVDVILWWLYVALLLARHDRYIHFRLRNLLIQYWYICFEMFLAACLTSCSSRGFNGGRLSPIRRGTWPSQPAGDMAEVYEKNDASSSC